MDVYGVYQYAMGHTKPVLFVQTRKPQPMLLYLAALMKGERQAHTQKKKQESAESVRDPFSAVDKHIYNTHN